MFSQGISVCWNVAGNRWDGTARGRRADRYCCPRMKLSIVIPVRNEVQTIATLVERVRAVDYGMSREIIIVDGASTDGTREALQALPTSPEVVLVLEDQAR